MDQGKKIAEKADGRQVPGEFMEEAPTGTVDDFVKIMEDLAAQRNKPREVAWKIWISPKASRKFERIWFWELWKQVRGWIDMPIDEMRWQKKKLSNFNQIKKQWKKSAK